MFGWFKLVGLRAQTIAVIEREYGRKLAVAGGADSQRFNALTRLARDMRGNEFDAAAMFMAADWAGQAHAEADASFSRVAHVMASLGYRMNRPDLLDVIWDRADVWAGYGSK